LRIELAIHHLTIRRSEGNPAALMSAATASARVLKHETALPSAVSARQDPARPRIVPIRRSLPPTMTRAS